MNTHLVYDMQYGSTGKGLLVGKLCEDAPPYSMAVSAMAPNAGHTYVHESGQKFTHSAAPLGIIFPNIHMVGLGPGSTIDFPKLIKELEYADKNNIFNCKDQVVLIHEHAGILTANMQKSDGKYIKIGSTMKGAGSAHVAKIDRDPDGLPCLMQHWKHECPGQIGRFTIRIISHNDWIHAFKHCRSLGGYIIIEGSQGYSLGLHSGFWPYTTYRECTPTQILSDCALPIPLSDIKLYGVARTFPIRVANRYNDKGKMVGTSGPCFSDQIELDWEDLGLDPEYTTVTRLKRRVFSFSINQFRECLAHTQPDVVFLNFMNYLTEEALDVFLVDIHRALLTHTMGTSKEIDLWYGYGPKSQDIEKEKE